MPCDGHYEPGDCDGECEVEAGFGLVTSIIALIAFAIFIVWLFNNPF
jgi:hypothetical protein